MAGIFSRLLGKDSALKRDGERIYDAVRVHSRNPVFYGEGKVPDTYDGRIDFLTLNIAVILKAIRPFGEDGKRLSQSIFDAMKDDFDVAMREEGISDKGVAKRIKPMMKLFYTRLKAYDAALHEAEPHVALISALQKGLFSKSEIVPGKDDFIKQLARYTVLWSKGLSSKTLGQIAMAELEISEF